MPPKEEAPKKVVEEVNTWDRGATYTRITKDNESRRLTAMESSRHVVIRNTTDPHRKLRERISTYHNIRRMRTDYKNYVKMYGEPSFDVPSKIRGN